MAGTRFGCSSCAFDDIRHTRWNWRRCCLIFNPAMKSSSVVYLRFHRQCLCVARRPAVFCDIRPDTLNMDEKVLKRLITKRTRAIVPVHYAGVGCAMDAILDFGAKRKIAVVEDNAHGLFGKYYGKHLAELSAFWPLRVFTKPRIFLWRRRRLADQRSSSGGACGNPAGKGHRPQPVSVVG